MRDCPDRHRCSACRVLAEMLTEATRRTCTRAWTGETCPGSGATTCQTTRHRALSRCFVRSGITQQAGRHNPCCCSPGAFKTKFKSSRMQHRCAHSCTHAHAHTRTHARLHSQAAQGSAVPPHTYESALLQERVALYASLVRDTAQDSNEQPARRPQPSQLVRSVF